MKYLIRRDGNIMGTYDGQTEQAVLDKLAKDEGYKSFDESCDKLKLVRDNYTVTKVEEI